MSHLNFFLNLFITETDMTLKETVNKFEEFKTKLEGNNKSNPN
jgi:hypothetical protein